MSRTYRSLAEAKGSGGLKTERGPRPISPDEVRSWIEPRRRPAFMVPSRFATATFENYEIHPDFPEHLQAVRTLSDFAEGAGQKNRFWQRSDSRDERGIYLLGAPGIGKTHLLAASFQQAPKPKIFASFDELAAAVSSLGVHALGDYLAEQSFLAIDEVTLDDPANIVLASTLIQRTLEGNARIVATANIRPDSDDSVRSATSTFSRELAAIADAFTLMTLEGRDYRQNLYGADHHSKKPTGRCLDCSWRELMRLLRDTHPMHDAWWLERLDAICIDGEVTPLTDSDDALRFVRFIDRVYDRSVGLDFACKSPEPESIIPELAADSRFKWHAARCHSRLVELIGHGA